MKNWIDTFMKIPFNTYKKLSVTADDGVDKCHEFMANAKQTLDTAVYGLNDAKMQVISLSCLTVIACFAAKVRLKNLRNFIAARLFFNTV